MKSPIRTLVFVMPVPIAGTSERGTDFHRAHGWNAELVAGGVRLTHASRKDATTKGPLSFTVLGVGFSYREDM